MKKLTSLLLTLTMIFVLSPCSMAEDAVSVTVGGAQVLFPGAQPYITDGCLMVPAEETARAMGLGYSFYPARGSAVISNGGQSVELAEGQLAVRLVGSTFVADEPAAVDENGTFFASAVTMARLAQYFGLSAEVDGRSLAVSFDSDFPVFVNGERLSFSNALPTFRDGIHYIPLEPVAKALGLEYTWNSEYLVATVSQPEVGGIVTVSVREGTVNIPVISFMTGENHILYEDYKLYLDADTVMSIAEYFGAAASYNYYRTGIVVSAGRAFNVKVNGTVVNFPDVQPESDGEGLLIPLRPIAEVLGCGLSRDGTEARLSYGEKTLILTEGQSTVIDAWDMVDIDRAPVLKADRLTVSPDTLLKIAERLSLTAEIQGTTLSLTDPSAPIYTAPEPVEENTEEKAGNTVSVSVSLDGRLIDLSDAAPLIVNEHTLIPVRVVAEEMGLNVEWDGGTGVLISDGADSLSLTIGSDLMTGIKDGEAVDIPLDVPVMAPDGHTCVPIRSVMEFFGATVGWDGRTSTITITSPRDKRETSFRDAESEEDFAVDLGFTVKAPLAAAYVSFAVVNENTARVNYSMNGAEYQLNATFAKDGATLNEDDFYGDFVSRRATVNGVPTTIYTGTTLYSTSAAIWTVGGLSFSLETSAALSSTAMLDAAEAAARTFVLVREIEPEEDAVSYLPDMDAAKVESSSFFTDLGLIMGAPEAADDVEFWIYGGKIAEIRFYLYGSRYTLRAAENGGDLTGLELETDGTVESFSLSAAAENTVAYVYQTADGRRAGLWNWGDVSFALICDDPYLPSLSFVNICTMCGELSSRTLELNQ